MIYFHHVRGELMDDLISRQDAIKTSLEFFVEFLGGAFHENAQKELIARFQRLPSAKPERLTDDDFETIRIHLNAQKERLCNQRRWKEAEDYERLINRFISFASTQPQRIRGRWVEVTDGTCIWKVCDQCGEKPLWNEWRIDRCESNYCPNCGARMDGGEQD